MFIGVVPQMLLGVVLTFAPPLYPWYREALERPGLGRALELSFGMTPAVDQQLGGLIMWVFGA